MLSKFLLSIEPRYLDSSTTGASPSPILMGGIALSIGQKLAKVNLWLPKVHGNWQVGLSDPQQNPNPGVSLGRAFTVTGS